MAKPIKILITTGIFPPDVGGPATQIERLATDLAERSFLIHILTYGSPEKKVRSYKVCGISRKWPHGLRQIFFGIKTFWLAIGADIIYTMDLYSAGFYSMAASKILGKKFVVRFAGDSAWETAFNLDVTKDDIWAFQEKKYTPFIEKRKRQRAKILKSADAIVAVSNFIKKLAEKIGVSARKISVIYNAVDFFDGKTIWQKTARPTLVFAGRLTPWKGVEMLIRVTDRLKRRYPDIIFKILGEGSERQGLENLTAQLGLKENVKFFGRVSEEESHQIFSSGTIFLLNTNYEGLPHSILNAMQIGIPVITTPVGGNMEIIENGENGLLVKYNDEEGWEEAIIKLLEDESLQERFFHAGRQAVQKFKWEELIYQTEELLRSVIKKK